MKSVVWDPEKNKKLQRERDISFEEAAALFLEGKALDLIEHHNPGKYTHQKMFFIEVRGYVFVVPFVEDEEKIFLKTIFPSRGATKKYIIRKRKRNTP